MKKIFFYLSVIAFFVACRQNGNHQTEQPNDSTPKSDSLAVVNDPKNNLNIQTNNFFEIDSSGILMMPLGMGELKRKESYSYSSSIYKNTSEYGNWNMIFYNSKTKEYHLLSEKKMIISRFEYKFSEKAADDIYLKSNCIFYEIRTEDFNKDKILNEEDPEYLFVSDRMGNNLRQISPSGCNLRTWKFIKNSNKVIMTVGKDSDKNGKFDETDEISTFEIELDKGTEPIEIFSNDFKNKLKILYDRDWKRIKK